MAVNDIEELEPQRVFHYFKEITAIPHGSYNIVAISNYIAAFAKEHNLRFIQEECGNVIIYKAATKGYENRPTVVIQGHMDMVAVKTAECTLDLTKDALDVCCDDEYVYARGTSLGGDDGIAVAYALAILESDSIEHPALEVVITVNEEVGMDGAMALDCNNITGRRLLNIDSEEEGILTVGCAGGQRVDVSFPYKRNERSGYVYEVTVNGLLGGHSGTMIHLERANANVIMGRILENINRSNKVYIESISGGVKTNAIADSCACSFVTECPADECIEDMAAAIGREYCISDPEINVTYNRKEASCAVIDEAISTAIINTLITEPNGVINYVQGNPSLVETSLNIGVINDADSEITLKYELRSSVRTRIVNLARRVTYIAESNGADVNMADAYPEWEYRPDSSLLSTMSECYRDVYGEEPKVDVVHAGLECGIFLEKMPDMLAVSFGPNILDIHTTNEKLDIKSVQRTWNYLLYVLKKIEI